MSSTPTLLHYARGKSQKSVRGPQFAVCGLQFASSRHKSGHVRRSLMIATHHPRFCADLRPEAEMWTILRVEVEDEHSEYK
jgi:hypothetical protein